MTRRQKEKLLDRIAMQLAKLVPDRIAYWRLIQIGAEHCGGPNHPQEETPAVPFVTVLTRYGNQVRA